MDIKAVLFDFDDTLTIPGRLDYAGIREDIGCPQEAISMVDRETLPGLKEVW